MAQHQELYKCSTCGNIVEVLQSGSGPLACCGQAMQLLTENTSDAAREKHLPVSEAINGVLAVKVGSIPHPMEHGHYIQWIEVIVGDAVYRQHLAPGMPPEAVFPIKCDGTIVRAYCNLHGQWSSPA